MTRKSTILSIYMALALVFMMTPSALAADTYNDISGHWARAAIVEWSDYGIIQGNNGAFRPDDSITRGEMATIIQRVMQYSQTAENTFSDLDSTAWYADPVLKLNAAQVMLGDGENIRPLDTITREESIVMLARALGLDQLAASGNIPFSDGGAISSWSINAVSIMCDNSYLSWAGDSFQPQIPITRAEVIATLDNIVQKLWRSNGLYCNEITGITLISATRAYLHNCQFAGDIIIAGGAQRVVIENSVVMGKIINLSGAEIITMDQNDGEVETFYFGDYELPILPELERNMFPAYNFDIADGRIYYNDPDVEVKYGIDVSEWQHDINWAMVAQDDIDFAIIRLGYRGCTKGELFLDECYLANIQGALNSGLDVGVYFYSQAITPAEAIEEAQMCLTYIRGYNVTYPIVFDWEPIGSWDSRTKSINGTTLTNCAIAFCETIKQAGYTPMVYSNKELALLTLDLSRLGDYPFWFAGYTRYPEFYYGFDFWQYISGGSVDGINGRVDMNIQFLD
jgi:lysozyme